MPRSPVRVLGAASAACLVTSLLAAAAPAAASEREPARHVLLLSVDGLHQSDLAWFVRNHSSTPGPCPWPDLPALPTSPSRPCRVY